MKQMGKKAVNLIGMQFGRWTVQSRADDYIKPNGNHVARWNCLCSCGNSGIVNGESLKSGKSQSCGCLAKSRLKHNSITTSEFIEELTTISPEIEVLGLYTKAKDPIHCKCKKCGLEWNPTPSNLKKGRGCPKCNGKYQRSHEEFVSDVAITNPSIEILGKYIDMHTRIDVRCKNCGNQWSPIAQSILAGYSCRECAKKKISEKNRLPAEEIYRRMQKAHPEIELLGTYIDAKTPVKCRCTVCGFEWPAKGSSLQQGKGCPSCTHQLSLSHDEFVRIISDISPSIEILSKYKNSISRVACRCKICGNTWNPIGRSLLVGSKCSKCADKARDERILASRKPHEQFVSELKEISPFIEVLGTYVNSTTPILVRCKHCSYQWTTKPPKLLTGSGCPECSSSSTSFMEKMILEAFRENLGKDAVISRNTSVVGYELDIYIPTLSLAIEPGSWFWHRDKVYLDQKKRRACSDKGIRLITLYDCYDDNDDAPFPSDCYTTSIDLGREKNHETLKAIIEDIFKSLNISRKFSQKEWKEIESRAYIASRKMSTEGFRKLMQEINPKIEVLGEYKASNEVIHCRCRDCGHEWNPLVSVLTFNRSGCPKCAGNMKLTHDEFVQIIKEKNPSIIVLGTYFNSQTHIEVQCKECGFVWSVKPNNLMKGTGCRECAKVRSSIKQRRTHDQFLSEMEEKGSHTVEILGKYINSNTKILCRCKVCGYEWNPYPYSLLQGHGCKKCADAALRKKRKVNNNLV